MLMSIFLIRHATPDWSLKDIPYHLPPGPPLTSQGRAEAYSLGNYLAQASLRQVYASPLERCQQTARIIAELTGAPLETLPALIEWQPGDTDAVALARIWPAFELACHVSEQTAGSVALVSHGGPIGVLLTALGMDAEALKAYRSTYDHGNPAPPAGAWEVNREPGSASWSFCLAFVPEIALA